jgi:hypothetical protein
MFIWSKLGQSMKSIVCTCLALWAMALPCVGRAADGNTMTFVAGSNSEGIPWGAGATDYIFAEGEITSDTPALFKAALDKYHAHPGTVLVLDSPGGDVDAALEMGRLVRAKRLWTQVGNLLPTYIGLSPNIPASLTPYIPRAKAPPFPGACYSSCTLLLLGGVVRGVDQSSDYGVHRFHYVKTPESAADLAQVDVAKILDYINEMGVSSTFISDMVKQGANDVTHLSEQRMAELRIITPNWTTSWEVTTDVNSHFALTGISTDFWGTHNVLVYCPRNDAERANNTIARMDLLIDVAGRADPNEFAKGVTDNILELDSFKFVLGKGIISGRFVSPNKRVGVTIALHPDLIKVIETTKQMGIAFISPVGNVKFAQFISTMNDGMFSSFIKQCPQPPRASNLLDSIQAAKPEDK